MNKGNTMQKCKGGCWGSTLYLKAHFSPSIDITFTGCNDLLDWTILGEDWVWPWKCRLKDVWRQIPGLCRWRGVTILREGFHLSLIYIRCGKRLFYPSEPMRLFVSAGCRCGCGCGYSQWKWLLATAAWSCLYIFMDNHVSQHFYYR